MAETLSAMYLHQAIEITALCYCLLFWATHNCTHNEGTEGDVRAFGEQGHCKASPEVLFAGTTKLTFQWDQA